METFPETGFQRILQLRFTFSEGREELRKKAPEALVAAMQVLRFMSFGEETSGAEKAQRLFLWMRDNVELDLMAGDEELDIPYGPLVRGWGSDAGIALAYELLCEQAGLDTLCVIGQIGDQRRVWNLVEVDGAWYHVDCTSVMTEEEAFPLFLATDAELPEGRAIVRGMGYPALSDAPLEDEARAALATLLSEEVKAA